MTERWYVVHVKTGSEDLAALNLRRQGFKVFLPLLHRIVRPARKIKPARAAFFPGYLFAAINLESARWRSIDGTFGVLGLVKAGNMPLAVPVGLVEALMSNCHADGALDLACDITPGSAVRFVRGPFADQLATVEQLSGPNRVRVLLSIMNQTVPVEVSRGALAPV